MIASRDLETLNHSTRIRAKAFLEECKLQGIDVLVTSTYRDNESQQLLYEQGRTIPGKIVTNRKGGDSYHNYRCAFDVVPVVNGKPVWDDDELWDLLGEIGKSFGLEWAGDWIIFKEKAHFQYTNGLTIEQLKASQFDYDII